jgi:shikimate dehydrogenase
MQRLEQIDAVSRQINITSGTRLFAVLGHPVAHSLSPVMQNAALAEMGLDGVYLAFDVPPQRLGDALRGMAAAGVGGVNLTIPLKEHAPPLLDWLSPEAERIGAVNTVRFAEGRLEGHNTDAPGFLQSLRSLDFDPAGKHCVVLGAGGSARAVAVALLSAGAVVTLANRTEERAHELARVLNEGAGDGSEARPEAVSVTPMEAEALERALAAAELLVNTTSVGMTPHADAPPPVPTTALHPRLLVYDLIYNPAETRLLAAARECGARTCNGVSMLAHQGALALEIWTGRPAPVATMERVLHEALGA